MAFTVTLKANKKCFLLGDAFTITATVKPEGEAELPQNLTYAWKLNNQPLEGKTTNEIVVTSAAAENGGTYKVTVTDTDTQEVVESKGVSVEEATLLIKINEKSDFIPSGSSVSLTSTVTYSTGFAPSDSYQLHYRWKKNGEPVGVETDNMTIANFTSAHDGEYTISVWGENELSIDNATIDLMAATLEVTEDLKPAVEVVRGKTLILSYKVDFKTATTPSEHMPKMKTTHNWYLQRQGHERPTFIGNEVGEAIEGFAIMPNGYLHKEAATDDDDAVFWCVATVAQDVPDAQPPKQEFTKTSTKCDVDILDSLHKIWRYVHPIPWRKTSFIYIGWWVFDEIVKFNEAGLEWRDRAVYSTSKYASDLETIAGAEEKHGDCTCMESRNGFMYNASVFHHLDREILEKAIKIRCTPPE